VVENRFVKVRLTYHEEMKSQFFDEFIQALSHVFWPSLTGDLDLTVYRLANATEQ
jgi:hypothetical protein